MNARHFFSFAFVPQVVFSVFAEVPSRYCSFIRAASTTFTIFLYAVYEKYSRHKESLGGEISETIAKSRILLLPDGLEKIESIEDTLKKYEKCSASDMVEITHAKGSPWDMKDASKYYQTIDDDLILEKHSVEEEYFRKQFCS